MLGAALNMAKAKPARGARSIDAAPTASQVTPMRFDPAHGTPDPFPNNAQAWRGFHVDVWRFNPWAGTRRDRGDIHTDPFGVLIVPPGEAIRAAA